MYYEEKIRDGILHFRSTPNSKFTPYSLNELTSMLIKEREKNEEKYHQGIEFGISVERGRIRELLGLED